MYVSGVLCITASIPVLKKRLHSLVTTLSRWAKYAPSSRREICNEMASDCEVLFESTEHPHSRFNPLKGEWVLVSPHRTKRPWLGKKEKPSECATPRYDPNNPLCPGNKRSNGEVRRVSFDFSFIVVLVKDNLLIQVRIIQF